MANKPSPRAAAPTNAGARSSTSHTRRPPSATPNRPGLVVSNAGPAVLEIYDTSGAAQTLGAGKSAVVAVCSLATSASGSTGPLSIAARSAVIARFVAKDGEAKVALDASSLRAQSALYGAPEIIVLQGSQGAVAPGDRFTVDVSPGVPVAAMVVGRGPIVNLGTAIETLFRARIPERAEAAGEEK